jgi:hypothetical protein
LEQTPQAGLRPLEVYTASVQLTAYLPSRNTAAGQVCEPLKSGNIVLLFVSGAFVVRMAQNFDWFEQPRLQHATLPGGILYNGLE